MNRALIAGIAAATAIGIASVVIYSQVPMEQPAEIDEQRTDVADKMTVYATFYPLAEFTRNVGADMISVKQLIPPNAEPHHYELTPKTLIDLEAADVLIFNGADFEPFVQQIMESDSYNLVFVDASDGIELFEGVDMHDDHGDEEHGDEEHGLGEMQYDPHVWLDPIRVKQQVDNIAKALAAADPENTERYMMNADAYKSSLDTLDADIREALSSCEKTRFVVFHNAFTYMADRYDLEVVTIIAGFDMQSPITAAGMEELAHVVEDYGIRYFLNEESHESRLADNIAEQHNATLVPFSSLERLTADDTPETTYFDKMYQNLDTLKMALECS